MAGLGYPGFHHLGGVSGLHPENVRTNNTQENTLRPGISQIVSHDASATQNPLQQNYQQQQHPLQQQQLQQQQQQFNNERSPNGAQNEEQKYRPGMQQQSSSSPSASEIPLGSPLSNSLPLQVQLSEGAANMNLNSSIGSNSIGNDDMQNIGNTQRNQEIQNRLSGTNIDNELNGGGDITEDDGSDLLSEMEMKVRLGKTGNEPQNISDPKQYKASKDTNSSNIENPAYSNHNIIKGENNEDVLQFPLGVRIKKEVLDPREEVSEEDGDELIESDNKQSKTSKRQSPGQRTNVIGNLPQKSSNKSNNEEESIEALKKAVADIPDVSQIWKVVRPKILSQCPIWDLLMDKASYQYYGENLNSEDTKNIATLNSKDANRSNLINSKKFRAVVSEMEALLGEFKCLMDGCLEVKSSKDTTEVQNRNNNPETGINGENNLDNSSQKDLEVSLSPELSRAYEKSLDTRWKLKDQNSINTLYQQFFSLNGEEPDKRNMMEMVNMEGSGNPFMPFGGKFDDSADEGEFDDGDEDFYFDDEEEGYDLDDDYDEGDMLDVKPPMGMRTNGSLEGSKKALRGSKKNRSRGTEVHECPKCNRRYKHSNNLKRHTSKCKGQPQSTDKEFHSQQVLDRHLQTNGGEGEDGENKPFECDLCDYKTNAHNGVALHKRSAHKVDKNNQQIIIDDNPFHQDRDSKRFAFVCEKCTRRYKSMKNLTRHQRNCNGVPPPAVKPTWRKDAIDGRYYCTFEGCNSKKNWTCSSGVWKHYNAEHADLNDATYGVYQCDLCDKRFPTKTMYNQHRKHKHLSLFEYTCSVCAKRLPSNERLKLHMRQHTGEKPFKCELCEYRSATQSAVNQHKMRMHEEQSPLILQRHVCEICGKSFKVKSNLKEHIRSHSDARTFLCGFCGKALKNRQCLNRHLFTHGVKYTCQVCGKNFANPSSLNVHKRDRHGLNV